MATDLSLPFDIIIEPTGTLSGVDRSPLLTSAAIPGSTGYVLEDLKRQMECSELLGLFDHPWMDAEDDVFCGALEEAGLFTW